MSKTLIKLIDSALVPAAVMILGKVLGLVAANTIFGLNWGIQTDPNNFFSVNIVYSNTHDQLTATSYSNLIMYLVIFIGFSVVLYRALYLHSSHITPKMLTKLATNNLLNLIEDSFEIYHKATVWLVVLWISLGLVVLNTLLGKAFIWTATLTFITTLIATSILLRDVAKEIELTKEKFIKGKLNANTKEN